MTNETQYPNPNGKSFSYFEFQRRWNPFRSPAWRFQWAQELAESDRSLPTEEGDVRALRAARYLRALAASRTEDAVTRVAQRYSAVHRAHEIFQADGPSRWLLEARLLARVPIREIARISSLSLSAVQSYVDLFYDVRSKLSATTYIFLAALGRRIDDMTTEDIGPILRYLGYCGGPLVLDAVAHYVLAPTIDVSLLPESEQRLARAVRRFVWVLTLRVEQPTEIEKIPAGQATHKRSTAKLLAEIARVCKEYSDVLTQRACIAGGGHRDSRAGLVQRLTECAGMN